MKRNAMKTNIRTTIVILCGLMGLFSACREEMPNMQNPRTDFYIYNWPQLFESLWSGLNYNYVFWDIDPTDWDDVYSVYKPRFDSLATATVGFENHEANVVGLKMLKTLLSHMIDHHMTVQVSLPEGQYVITPGDDEVSSRDGYHPRGALNNYRITTVMEKLKADGRLSHELWTRQDDDFCCGTEIIDGDIIRLWFNHFLFTRYIDTENDVTKVLDTYYALLDTYPDVKGVIIDVRDNGGGYVDDLPLILGKLIKEDMIFAYSRTKSGIGRLDFSPWIPATLLKEESRRLLDVPVVVLADMNSISMCEMTTLVVKEMPQGCFIGERTFAGMGLIKPSNGAFELTYSGYFENNVLMCYTTNTATKSLDGQIYEGKGIMPVIEVLYDEETLRQGIDTQLERAITYIHTGR